MRRRDLPPHLERILGWARPNTGNAQGNALPRARLRRTASGRARFVAHVCRCRLRAGLPAEAHRAEAGARGRTRTGTALQPGDFKSPASTIPPPGRSSERYYVSGQPAGQSNLNAPVKTIRLGPCDPAPATKTHAEANSSAAGRQFSPPARGWQLAFANGPRFDIGDVRFFPPWSPPSSSIPSLRT